MFCCLESFVYPQPYSSCGELFPPPAIYQQQQPTTMEAPTTLLQTHFNTLKEKNEARKTQIKALKTKMIALQQVMAQQSNETTTTQASTRTEPFPRPSFELTLQETKTLFLVTTIARRRSEIPRWQPSYTTQPFKSWFERSHQEFIATFTVDLVASLKPKAIKQILYFARMKDLLDTVSHTKCSTLLDASPVPKRWIRASL